MRSADRNHCGSGDDADRRMRGRAHGGVDLGDGGGPSMARRDKQSRCGTARRPPCAVYRARCHRHHLAVLRPEPPLRLLYDLRRVRFHIHRWRHLAVFRLNAVVISAWLGFAGGLFVVIGTLSSVVGTLVVPRSINSRISRLVERGLDALFLQLARGVSSFARRDRILAWQSPLALLLRLSGGLGLLVVGFALLLLPSLDGHVGQAFSDAGSSMFTLGYAAPVGSGSTALEYLAAFVGLVVIGLQVGYLPA